VGAVRPPARLTSLLAVGSALLAAAPAVATVDDSVQFGAPSGGRQQLVVTMSDDAAAGDTTLYATYRPVDAAHPPSTNAACAPTAANGDTRLIDGVTESPGSYTVTESISLPLGMYAVCTYRATPSSADPSAAGLQSARVGGTPPPTPATSISIMVSVRRLRGTFRGTVTGTRTGTVSIQRSVGGRWRAVKRARVRAGGYRITLRVHRGASYRAVLIGTATYATSHSAVVRIA
jgi:hypothetical protein